MTKHKHSNRHRPNSFTLLELLVVIGIVLLLVSMLLPALSTVERRMQTLTCAHNLRQIITATHVYAGSNRGLWPDCWRWVWSDGGSGGLWVEWSEPETVPRGLLFPYLARNEKIFLCPTFKWAYALNPSFSHLTPYVGYSMNEYLTSQSGGTWAGVPKINYRQVSKLSELGVYGDEGTVETTWNNGGAVINNLCLGIGSYFSSGRTDALATFHNVSGNNITNGFANVAYGDGHVSLEHARDTKEIFTPDIVKTKAWP